MKKPRKKSGSGRTDTKAPSRTRRGDSWDDRLRRVGDARFVEVAWSTRDKPSWPLPADAED